jgi:hypothetical protein
MIFFEIEKFSKFFRSQKIRKFSFDFFLNGIALDKLPWFGMVQVTFRGRFATYNASGVRVSGREYTVLVNFGVEIAARVAPQREDLGASPRHGDGS